MTAPGARLLAGALALAGGACGGPGEALRTEVDAAGAAGCWVLAWTHDGAPVAGPGVPDSVRLDTASACRTCRPGERGPGGTVSSARAAPDTARPGPGDALPWWRAFAPSRWEQRGADSVEVVFNDNWTQYTLRAEVSGVQLHGSVIVTSDVEPAGPPSMEVTGSRIPCPSPAARARTRTRP